MSANLINYQILNKEFENIENNIKKEVRKINELDPFCSIIPTIVDSIHALTKKTFDEVNLLSISFLVDDIFIITFPHYEDYSMWNTYSFFNEGSIGNQCRKALITKEKVTAYQTKIKVINEQVNLTQRSVFQSEKCNVQSHFVSPLIIHETIIGRIQISFKKEVNDSEKQAITDYISWLNDKIIWIMYSEFIRVNNIIHNLNSVIEVLLGDIDEYQAKHSQNVSKLAKALATVIVKERENHIFTYRDELGVRLDGVDILKLQIAGLLHDIGKVKMWTFDKFNSELEMRKRNLHPYFSYSIINKMQISEDIADVASFHHESINGKGEPFAIEKNTMNIVTQLIKCVDIIDSSLRKRPVSGKDKPDAANNKDKENLQKAIDALQEHKDEICQKVLNTVIAILSDIRDFSDKDIYKVRKLLRIDEETVEQVTISIHPDIDTFLNNYLNNLDWNKWVVVFVFQCKNANLYSYTKDENKTKVLFLNNKELKNIIPRNKSDFVVPFVLLNNNMYFGVYNEAENKEYAYSFCESLDTYLGVDKKLACAFLSHSVIHMDNFQAILNQCVEKLQNICSNMGIDTRWQLLRFNVNKKEWK